jgi:hypothetical protein
MNLSWVSILIHLNSFARKNTPTAFIIPDIFVQRIIVGALAPQAKEKAVQ